VPIGSCLDERKNRKIVICRSAKGIAAERSKAPGVWSGPAPRSPIWNGKRSFRLFNAPSKIVVARVAWGTAGARKVRCFRPRPAGPRLIVPCHLFAGFPNNTVERRTAGDRRDAQHFPALSQTAWFDPTDGVPNARNASPGQRST